MARIWIARLAAGEVDDNALEALRKWRESGADNNAAFEAERRLYRSLGPLEPVFAAPQPAELPVRHYSRARLLGAPAALLACVLSWIAFDPLILLRADRTTGSGEIAQMALPDGSSALLNSKSAIAIGYDQGQRRIHLLRGEVWFDVKPDPTHPFIVDAEGVTARAVGTAYSVRRLEDGGVVLAVSRGIVDFGAANLGNAIRVAAGQSARIDPGRNPRFLSQRAGDLLAWSSGRIIIENESLSEVAGELSRYRRGKIVVLGSASTRRVSGVLKVDEIDRDLDGIAASEGLSITQITPWLVVLR